MSYSPDSCQRCLKPDPIYKCGRCNFVVYCSEQCQSTDWPVHRNCCNTPRYPEFFGYCDRLLAMPFFMQQINQILPVRTPNKIIVASLLPKEPNTFRLTQLRVQTVDGDHDEILLTADVLRRNADYHARRGDNMDGCMVLFVNFHTAERTYEVYSRCLQIENGHWPTSH